MESKEFKVSVQSGKGQYYKSVQDIYVNGMTFADMADRIKTLEAYCKRLEALIGEKESNFKKYQASNDKALDLVVKATDLCSRQIANLRQDVDEMSD